MKELKESDLQIGDILIFENQDFSLSTFYELLPSMTEMNNKEKLMPAAFYLLLYMIPWFDPGEDPKNYKNIYHAAIWGNVNVHRGENQPVENLNRIVQAGTNGIGQAELQSTLKGFGVKNIYVYRYQNKPIHFEQNINTQIRHFYDDVSIQYSYETAWLLAVICSMRYSDGALYELLQNRIGSWGADFMIGIIQDLINQYNNDHQKEMVACSTLVSMIYKDASYPLLIKGLDTNKSLHMPMHFDGISNKPALKNVSTKTTPNVTINETVVTPRQLLESKSVTEVGYLPFIKESH